MFYRRTILILFLTILVSGIQNAIPQTDSEIDEPIQEFFQSPTVFTQNQYEIQVSARPQLLMSGKQWNTTIPLEIEYGILRQLELIFELPYLNFNNSPDGRKSGFGNIEVGMIYNFTLNNDIAALSTSLGVEIPTAKKGLIDDDDKLEFTPMLILGKQFGRGQIHTSIGRSFTNGEKSFLYNLAFVYPVSSFKTTFELSGLTGDDDSLFLTPGIIYNQIDGLELGLGITKNITEEENEYGILLNIIYEFGDDE